MTIEHVSDTARWVAVYRAMETDRPDAHFRDPWARRLAGAQGQAIVDSMPNGKRMAWPMIVRTAVFDEIILECVRSRGVDLVVNLAAGLDTRPWRLDLPHGLRWVDVDHANMVDYKRDAMRDEKPHCRYEAIGADLTDVKRRDAILSQMGRESQRALVVSEGLLIYLTPEDVGSLATSLHAQPAFRWWLLDLASPMLIKRMQKSWGKKVAAGNAPFRFAPAESTKFFNPFGWREAQFRSTMEDARRLKREMPGMWFWRLLTPLYPKKMVEQMKRFSGAVLLERT